MVYSCSSPTPTCLVILVDTLKVINKSINFAVISVISSYHLQSSLTILLLSYYSLIKRACSQIMLSLILFFLSENFMRSRYRHRVVNMLTSQNLFGHVEQFLVEETLMSSRHKF